MKAVRRLELRQGDEREERVAQEILTLLHHGCGGMPGRILRISEFARQLGPWSDEVFRALADLDHQGYVVFLGAGPTVSITSAGVARVEGSDRSHRRAHLLG